MVKRVMTYCLDEAEVTAFLVGQEMIILMAEQEGTLCSVEKVTTSLSVRQVSTDGARVKEEKIL